MIESDIVCVGTVVATSLTRVRDYGIIIIIIFLLFL